MEKCWYEDDSCFDKINYWSEIKLEILKKYAAAYSKILSAQTFPRLHHVYIDAFAGPGIHFSKQSKDFVLGSPLNALLVEPPFKKYFFIDLNGKKIEFLRKAVGDDKRVSIFQGDCNQILLKEVFPDVQYEQFRRGLCILDPYGLHLNWKVIETAGKLRTIDMILNFPIEDINRNGLWHNLENVTEHKRRRLTEFWGDESWMTIAYQPKKQLDLFKSNELEKVGNPKVAEGFRKRLLEVAGFSYVPEPLPMRNSKNAIIYYLYFASQKPVAAKIITDIFNTYRNRTE